jgi:hypothetical protein
MNIGNVKVVAICGMKRVGKDTAAMFIEKTFDFKHVKISEPLKRVCNILFGFTHEQMENDTKDVIDERYGITPRKVMQFMGTEMMQYKLQELMPAEGRSFWINTLLRQEGGPIVISDMRFLHEAQAIKKKYGAQSIIIKVVRQGLDNVDEHTSEKEWTQISEDFVVNNNKDISYFEREIFRILSDSPLGKAYSP